MYLLLLKFKHSFNHCILIGSNVPVHSWSYGDEQNKVLSECKLKMHDQVVIIYTVLQNYDSIFIFLLLK